MTSEVLPGIFRPLELKISAVWSRLSKQLLHPDLPSSDRSTYGDVQLCTACVWSRLGHGGLGRLHGLEWCHARLPEISNPWVLRPEHVISRAHKDTEGRKPSEQVFNAIVSRYSATTTRHTIMKRSFD